MGDRVESWTSAHQLGVAPPWWVHTLTQVLTLSCDVGWRQDAGVGASGWVLMDHEGQLCGVSCRRVSGGYDSLMLEVWAIADGLKVLLLGVSIRLLWSQIV